MKKITVNASADYDIYIGRNLLPKCGEYIKNVTKAKRIFILSDDNVAPLYLDTVIKSLAENGLESESYIIPHGEQSKNAENFIKILNRMAELHFTRSDAVCALGGGVVGDMAGFCSAAYMRGVDFIQLPTSLLAAVDSSVGGKTAIDLDFGKNLAGAFKQPKTVICDLDTLKTLTDEVFSDGMAEVIKYAMIRDESLMPLLNDTSGEALEEIVSRCVSIKRDVVNEDEFETGVRKILNFGHTIGHAVELASDFKLMHGHAVAIGMHIITAAFEKNSLCVQGTAKALDAVLARHNLPVSCEFDADTLYNAALSDKKRSGNKISIIVPEKVGECSIKSIDISELGDIIKTGVSE